MTTSIPDQFQRERALDSATSFIVQAPAGSGKTELLTQRFLVLLSVVKQPEEILAITFTKKSAAEMRARIINALKNACYEPKPISEHAQKTWQLAKNALARNDTLKWDLLDNPSRLRIQTIDSFNASLTRQLPILSHFGAPPEITDNPYALYSEAVQEFLSHLEEDVAWSDAIAQLLLHMDNDLNKVEKLLIDLLAKRDQWLPYIALNATDPELRKNLEYHLAEIVTDTLSALKKSFPAPLVDELIKLANYAGHNLAHLNPASASACCASLTSLPGYFAQDKKYWLGLSHLLLTADLEWRKKVDSKIGFLPPSSAKNVEEKAQLKDLQQRMLILINQLSQHEDILILLKELNQLPDSSYQDHQWSTLNALHHALRIVVAQLKVTFQSHGKIDYIENAQAALTALGTDEAPTDITLSLDYRIQHILIDEFQDTSNNQYRLLEKLIAGWETHDGRTLFVVGDPMQSIYRFREADVGLFIRARKKGIAHVALEPLTLCVNFRSTPSVVNWINERFKKVLPPFEDISSGAVSYSASIANKTDSYENDAVLLHPFFKNDQHTQANKIIQLIKQAKLKNPDGSIAILVRSRTHLADIIPALKKENLPYRAINIDPLSTRPVIQDLIALTKALLYPTDRIAWLAILRAPWCGLTLADLLIIANNKEKIIWQQLQATDIITQLSIEGQQQINRIKPILTTKFFERRRFSLRTWIESTWISLGGPACVEQILDLEDATAFFKLLDKLDHGGDLSSIEELNDQISALFAATNNQADHSLQIMTIHNAKGLEFDTVILPHLERKPPNEDKQLLLWMERARQENSNSFILSPSHAVGEDTDSIYEYIKRQNAIKLNYENGRLLYVAATRAKKELHLLFDVAHDENNLSKMAAPSAKSLLGKIWNSILPDIPSIEFSQQNLETDSNFHKQAKRLSKNWIHPLNENNSLNLPAYQQQSAIFELTYDTPKKMGTLIHFLLQQLCLHGVSWWQEKATHQKIIYVKTSLTQLGVLTSSAESLIQHVIKAIENTLHDSRGQWILQKHLDSQTEFAITTLQDSEIKSLIIDRTFVDEQGTRWIIDYKTTHFSGDDIETFLESEKKQHEPQLFEYYQAMRNYDDKPIRVALYFPLIPAWCEWIF